jgi:membrane protein implicated in regulation of membrane protease activity
MAWFEALDVHWYWLAAGLLLAAAEMAAPGFFMIWLGAAALVTGLVTWAVPIGVPIQVVVFAALAIASVLFGRSYFRANPIESADPKMNDRGARLVGETVVVTHAIDGGSGRVKQGDGEWLAKGPDAEPGTRMRVAGHDGVVLIVEHLQ